MIKLQGIAKRDIFGTETFGFGHGVDFIPAGTEVTVREVRGGKYKIDGVGRRTSKLTWEQVSSMVECA